MQCACAVHARINRIAAALLALLVQTSCTAVVIASLCACVCVWCVFFILFNFCGHFAPRLLVYLTLTHSTGKKAKNNNVKYEWKKTQFIVDYYTCMEEIIRYICIHGTIYILATTAWLLSFKLFLPVSVHFVRCSQFAHTLLLLL